MPKIIQKIIIRTNNHIDVNPSRSSWSSEQKINSYNVTSKERNKLENWFILICDRACDLIIISLCCLYFAFKKYFPLFSARSLRVASWKNPQNKFSKLFPLFQIFFPHHFPCRKFIRQICE